MNFINKFNLEKNIIVINFNWAAILAFVTFWSYGFFGALTAKSFGLVVNIINSLILCGIFILFLWLWHKNDLYKDSIVIKNKDILVFVVFFLVMLILSYGNLTNSLNGDQLAHAQQSKLHSITLIDFLSNKTDAFNNFVFKYFIYIIDLLMVVVGFFIYKFTKNKSWFFKATIFSSLFLIFRFIVMTFGGSAGPHPSFRLFPLWFFSAIFTSTDFSFRLAQFVGLIGLMWLIQKIVNKKLDFINSCFFALAVGTIPVLWHVGVIVEQSIWTAVSWTTFLLYLFAYGDNKDDDRDKRFNYIRWVSIISIFTMLRQPVFIALLPLFLIIIIDLIRRKELDARKIFILMSPVFVMFPFLLNSIINGTSASYIGEVSGLRRVWTAFDSGIFLNAITNSISWLWLIFLFAPFVFIFKKSFKILTILIFFIAGVYVFYMITPDLWGIGRYQSEYIIPFIALGFFLFINLITNRYNFVRKFFPIIFILMIFCNISVFKNLPNLNKPINELKVTFTTDVKIRGAYAILSEFPYEYKQAFVAAEEGGYAGNVFVAGITYGVFSEILNNFTVSEIKAGKSIYKEMYSDFSVENINKNNKIKLVLISDFINSDKLKNDMENLRWKKWKEFKNEQYGSTIFGLIRSH